MAGEKVLVVEDNALNMELALALLEKAGCVALEATSAEEGIELAKTALPRLILMDVNLPDMDGLSAVRLLKHDAATKEIPIVVLTAHAMRGDEAKALEAGCDDYLTKPIDTRQFLQMVARFTATRRDTQHETSRDTPTAATGDALSELQRSLAEAKAARAAANKAHQDAVQRLAWATEYSMHGESAAGHIRRVGDYCGLLAQHRGLPDEEIQVLCAAGPLHDAGLVGVPGTLLRKAGTLDDVERTLMRQHPLIGARLLRGSSSPLLQRGEVIALSHHEKWDGGGYPHGLAGTDIPLAARICALADVFDALTSARPYRDAFDNEQAFQIMRGERGRHFDPELLDLFLTIRKEIVAVQAETEVEVPGTGSYR